MNTCHALSLVSAAMAFLSVFAVYKCSDLCLIACLFKLLQLTVIMLCVMSQRPDISDENLESVMDGSQNLCGTRMSLSLRLFTGHTSRLVSTSQW